MRRTFILLFLALALFATLTHREVFFQIPTYEEGDDAANALQIYRAKRLQELHGNYSRWGFHHPGPAFFYAYAAGEAVLYDFLGVAPSPSAAHTYTSTLVQLGFFAAAIALLARQSRQPLLFLGLAVAAGGWHFGHVYRAVYSIWPPDVLLMPFLCFVAACASTAIGNRIAVPLLILSGGFLVHGHVAQPLFVVPLAGAAFAAGFIRRERLTSFVRSRTGVASMALLGLLLLPLVLDLFAGKNSNVHDIWLHMKHQSDDGQTLAQSLLCYASYFVGMNDPSMFNEITASSVTPFLENLPLLAGWVTILVFAIVVLFRRTSEAGKNAEDVRLGRSLLWFWLAGGALTVVWGMRQDGGFTSFNSHFNHSLVFIVALLGLLAAVRLIPCTSRPFGAFLVAASVPVFVLSVELDRDPWSRGNELDSNVDRLLRADPYPNAPKFIRYVSTYPNSDWYEAVTLARAFQRRGIEFYVGPDERVMFGREKVFENRGEVLSSRGLSVWQLVRRESAPPEARVLNRVCSVVFPRTPSATLPLHLDARSSHTTSLALVGLEGAEEEWAWTTGRVTVFRLEMPAAETDLELILDASGLTVDGRGQQAKIVVNGREVGRTIFDDQRQKLRVPIARETWNALSPRAIIFELPDAIAPAHFAPSGDRRLLGLRFHSLSITEKQ